MVAQARKLQDAVQRRLPDVRIVFQEGRAWQIDGPLEVCEHRGAMDSGRHWTVTTNFCISGSLLLVTPNHTPSPAPRVEKPEVGTRAHIKPTPGHMHLMVHSPLPAKHKMERNLNP